LKRSNARFFGVVVAIASVLAIVPSAHASGGQNPGAGDPNPLVGQKWWDQNTKWNLTWKSVYELLAAGRIEDATLVYKLAAQPQFRWWGQWEKPLTSKVKGSLASIDKTAPGAVPLMVSMRHQGKACNSRYMAGGAAEDAAYKRWVDEFAGAIGDREVVIAFEPDSMGTIECLAKSRRSARLKMLAYGVDALSRLPRATVYIDAGASDWQGVPTMARKLRAVGVAKVRGFMLNATHQATNASNISYGEQLSRKLGGKHFIVNTSHNGNGPMYQRKGDKRGTVWCNPPNAAAGVPPTTDTGHPLVDAFLWVERPGFSNGACNGGPPRVGDWWLERALQMARRAKW